MLPDLSKIFKRRRIVQKQNRVKKHYPNFHYPKFEIEESRSRCKLSTKNNHRESDFENYGKEYDPYYKFRNKDNSKEFCSAEEKYRLDEREEEEEELKSNLKKEKVTLESSNSEILQEKKIEDENSGGKRSIDELVGSKGGLDLKNFDLETKISDKVVEKNLNLDSVDYDTTRDLIQRKHLLVDVNKAISDKIADSAHNLIEGKAQLIDTMRIGNLIIAALNKSNTESGRLVRNRQEKEENNEEENNPVEEKITSAEVENVPLQEKNIALQKMIIEPENLISNTNFKLNNAEEFNSSSESIIPDDSKENNEPWDFKSDSRNHEIMENAVKKMKEQFGKMIGDATENNQKRNNYDIESEVVDLVSKTLKEVISSFTDDIPKVYFPGSSQREFENNFFDTRSNSGFDFVVSDPETSKCSASEEPFYNDNPDGFGTCPKCNSRDDMCFSRNYNDPNDNFYNKRHKRNSQQKQEFKGRDIILRPEHFFYDSTLHHIQDMRAVSALKLDFLNYLLLRFINVFIYN